MALLALLGPCLLGGALIAVLATVREADLQGWAAFDRGELFTRGLADELGHALRCVLLAALPAALWLGFGRRTGALRTLWAAAWMGAVLATVAVWRDWRVVRRRDGWDVPQILWQRERLVPALAIGAGLALFALAATLWLRRRAARRGTPTRADAEPRTRARLASAAGLAAGVLALAVWGIAVARAASLPLRARTPVLYVTWDSTRADHVSAYGYERETTPHFDALARDGVLFERAYSQHNWTRPAYASIFTSMPQWGRADRGLDPFHWTLAEELRAAGYATRALIQNPNISGYFGFAQGFDRFVEYRGHVDEIVARARGWLADLARGWRDDGRPFLLFVHLNEPHWPYRHEQALASGFTTERVPPLDERAVDALMRRQWRPRADEVDARALAYLFAAYDAEILAADRGLGVLLAALEAEGLADDTLVVVNSDHGDEFYERGNFGHAHPNVYPELVRVPFVVRPPLAPGAPGAPGGAGPQRGLRWSPPVESLDLFPTLCGALGLAPPPGLVGRDLWPRLSAPELRESERGFFARSFDNGRLALRTFDHALHLVTAGGATQFYRLDDGLAELEPTAPPADAEWARTLRAGADAWQQERVEAALPREQTGLPDADLTEELRRLGYL